MVDTEEHTFFVGTKVSRFVLTKAPCSERFAVAFMLVFLAYAFASMETNVLSVPANHCFDLAISTRPTVWANAVLKVLVVLLIRQVA